MKAKLFSKLSNPKSLAIKHISDGTYLIGEHTLQRMYEREIDVNDITSVILNGWYVPKRDRKSIDGHWSYCFEGKDFDKKRLIRVVVSFQNEMFLVTVVDLEEQR